MVRTNRVNRNALKSAVRITGLWQVDKRSLAARMLYKWRRELIQQLGGDPSPAQLALIDLGVRTRLYIESFDAFLVGEKSLINRKLKSAIPLVQQRQSLVDSLTKILKHLGLKRAEQSGKVLSLKEYWEQPVVESEDHAEKSSAK
jgi:hypothetical protein